MYGSTSSLRGDGLARVQRILSSIEDDPSKLDRARARFDRSPPPCRTTRSATTLSQSPDAPSEEEQRRQEQREQLYRAREASKPRTQFSAQSHDEEQRIFQASLDKTIRLPVGSNQYEIARQNIKRCWVEQGIWNDNWGQFASGLWKHEEPLEVESETETDSEAESPLGPFTFLVTPLPSKKRWDGRQLKSEEDRRRISERRVVREREREASRPYYQSNIKGAQTDARWFH